MGKEISWEIREQAEELYVVDGLTFDQVAEKTGVSASQLKRWAAVTEEQAEEGAQTWGERRREYRTAFANIRRDLVLLRKRLVANALKSLNPQDVFAISSLESTAAKLQQQADGADPGGAVAGEPIQINTPAEAVDALQTVVERRINTLLTRPDQISLKAVKELKETLTLIEKMQAQYSAGETQEKKILSADEIKELRDQLL